MGCSPIKPLGIDGYGHKEEEFSLSPESRLRRIVLGFVYVSRDGLTLQVNISTSSGSLSGFLRASSFLGGGWLCGK